MADKIRRKGGKKDEAAEGRTIKIHELVEVYYTDQHPYAGEAGGVGAKGAIHPIMADKLEKAGWISKKPIDKTPKNAIK